MLVMANNVMEKPGMTGNPGLKAKDDFQAAIPDRPVKRWQVLMMMAERTDAGLGKYADQHPGSNESQTLDEKEDKKIESKQQDKK